MKTYSKRRGVHVTDADLLTLRAKGFPVRDSWKPRPVPTADTAIQANRYGSGMRADLGLYVRSRWEANYGRILNLRLTLGEIDGWKYEPKEFEFPVKRGNRFYKPDFQVFSHALGYHWVELKGYMKPGDASSVKLKRMQKYYPQEQVILIREREYQELERTYAKLIPEWEYA